jgi:hypothetical protein
MPRSIRSVLIGGAVILAAGSAATLRTGASPHRPGPALSVSHQTDQTAVSRPKPSSGQTIFRFDTFGALFGLNLSAQQKADLVEFLKSI